MASGKLSPRQKMINMMYLVLLALLALNVSAEILNAFQVFKDKLGTSALEANALEKYGLQPGHNEVGTRPNPGYPFAGPGLRSAYQHAHVLPCPPLLSPHPALGCGCT